MRTPLDCCPVCGHTPIETFWDNLNLQPKYKCHCCGWNNFENDKKEEKTVPPTRCPNCDSMLRLSDTKSGPHEKAVYECPKCSYKYKVLDIPKQDNPYTEFAKEMSLLHEALKAEGFKDSMVDILAKMTPIVWDKVTNERARKTMKEAYLQQRDTEAMLRAVRKIDNPYATRRGELNVGGAGGCTEGDGIR